MKNKIKLHKLIKTNIINIKIFVKIITSLIIFYSLFYIINTKDKYYKTNFFNIMNISNLHKKNLIFDKNVCLYIKNELNKRYKPFKYEEEFFFFTSLISCKIPFSFIRFGDGEASIMKGTSKISLDRWHWFPNLIKFRNSLIESASICTYPNSFIGLPCKDWVRFSNIVLSYSKCNSSKYMSYGTLFVNKNYQQFKYWITHFIQSSDRWKIILIANSNINKNISWAYKFFPIPNNVVEIWNKYSLSFLSKLSKEAKQNNLLFFVSAGPVANVISVYK